jgi:ABC-type sugar transport system permease subunit
VLALVTVKLVHRCPLYTFDAEQNAVVNNETGVVYFADMEIGNFISDQLDEEGNPLTLDVGFWVSIGFENFDRFLTSPAISGPLLQIFVWTVVFAIISVLSTFALGLFYALLLNAKVPGHRIFRTLLIVPYAIPGIIAVAIWKGMLNPNFGVLSALITQVFGSSPEFFADPNWAKFGILFINLWLGYPYFLLVCSGALAAIPSDMYEAAKVDGANFLQQFRFLTLPMLLVAVGPLLVASFTYNFNNFVIIEVYNEGGPPIPGAATPAGYTDILISYTYRLAFGGGRGADYGLASAITIIIFLMVAAVTLLQFRFTRQLEEVSENV